jgi:hypothetical protein
MAEWAGRNGEYDENRQLVDGQLWRNSGRHALPVAENRYSIAVNYLLPIAQKHVQMLVGRLPGLQVMPRGTELMDREHAEKEEGLLYAAWSLSEAQEVFQRTAWDSFVLRRGLIYYWWDLERKRARFKYVTPDDFYPEYDGDEVYRAVYVHRRNIHALRRQYPKYAKDIEGGPASEVAQVYKQDTAHMNQVDYVTVTDYYDIEGNFVRLAGDLVLESMKLGYPEPQVPFVEFPYQPTSGWREPPSGVDQVVELTQYLSQLISQKADVIRTYANPTVIDEMSGQSVEEIRRAVAADGSVLPVARDGNIRFLNWDGTVPTIDEQITLVLDSIFDISGKPRSSFGQTITNQSGVVTNLALTPTLQSNEAHESIWGKRLAHLNRRLLQITEKFGPDTMSYRGVAPTGADHRGAVPVNLEMSGKDIDGWYENRIKWPSAIRTDDPVYIQNIVSRLTSDPPTLSIYSALEMFGHEDVEAEIDRILEQKEDPRLSPESVATNVGTALQAGPPGTPAGLLGAEAGPSPEGGQIDPTALEASGSPATEELA